MNNVLNTLGLCKRANKLISGEEIVLNRVKLNKANPKYTRKEEKKLLSDSIMKQNRMARLIKGL